MKSKKPLTGKELEAFEASRDIGKVLLKSARQMAARKGRAVLPPDIFARAKSACYKQNKCMVQKA